MSDARAAERQTLLDLLSELLAVVRAGLRLYRDGVDTTPAELRDRLLEYGDESQRHVDLLEQAVRDLGGDPAYESPHARFVGKLSEIRTSEVEDDPARSLYFRLEGLLVFELRDAIIGEVLEGLAASSEDPEARQVLDRMATTVRSGAALGAHDVSRPSERIEWLEQAMRTAALDRFGVTPATRGARFLRGYR
jgi:hypothetical protein